MAEKLACLALSTWAYSVVVTFWFFFAVTVDDTNLKKDKEAAAMLGITSRGSSVESVVIMEQPEQPQPESHQISSDSSAEMIVPGCHLASDVLDTGVVIDASGVLDTGVVITLSADNVHAINAVIPFNEFTPSPVSMCTFSPSPHVHTSVFSRAIKTLQEAILKSEQHIDEMKENVCRLQETVRNRTDALERMRSRDDNQDRSVRPRLERSLFTVGTSRMLSAGDSTASAPDFTAEPDNTVPNSPEEVIVLD